MTKEKTNKREWGEKYKMGIFDGIKKMFTDEDVEKMKDGENKNVNQLISEIKKTNTPVKSIDYNHFTTRVTLVDNGEDILNKISPGHEFELKRDKNNSVDPYAVAIFYSGTYIGVLKKEVAKSVAMNIDKGINYLCVVTNVIGSGSFNYLVDIKLDAYDIHVMCLNCGRDVVIADEGIWNCSYCGAKLPQGKIGMTEPQRSRNINPSMNSQMNYNRSVNYNNQSTMNQQSMNYNMNNQNTNYNNMTQSTINYNNNMNNNNSMNYNNMTQSTMNNQNMNYNRNQNSMNYQQSVNYNGNQSTMNNQNYNRNYNEANTQSVNYNNNQNMNYNRNQNVNYNRNQNDMNSTMSVNYRNRRNNEYEQDNYIEKIYNSKKDGYEDEFLNYIPEKEDDDEIVRLDPFNNGNDYF